MISLWPASHQGSQAGFTSTHLHVRTTSHAVTVAVGCLQIALYDTPGVTSAVRSRDHNTRVQGAWQVHTVRT